jgi:hypothetical protein
MGELAARVAGAALFIAQIRASANFTTFGKEKACLSVPDENKLRSRQAKWGMPVDIYVFSTGVTEN